MRSGLQQARAGGPPAMRSQGALTTTAVRKCSILELLYTPSNTCQGTGGRNQGSALKHSPSSYNKGHSFTAAGWGLLKPALRPPPPNPCSPGGERLTGDCGGPFPVLCPLQKEETLVTPKSSCRLNSKGSGCWRYRPCEGTDRGSNSISPNHPQTLGARGGRRRRPRSQAVKRRRRPAAPPPRLRGPGSRPRPQRCGPAGREGASSPQPAARPTSPPRCSLSPLPVRGRERRSYPCPAAPPPAG